MTLRAAKKRLRNDSATGIKDLRDVSVLVMHPDDEDGRNLIEQLQRIGCQVRAMADPGALERRGGRDRIGGVAGKPVDQHAMAAARQHAADHSGDCL